MTGASDMRRGRPRLNSNETSAENTDENAPETGAEKPRRRRVRGDVNGMRLKLDAPQRLGYVRRWFHDDGNRIADAQERLAYDFVEDGSIKSDAPGTRIARRVGTKANGEPLYDYLMETPIEEYRAGEQDKEAEHKKVDDAIKAGRPGIGDVERSYGSGDISTRVR